MTTPRSLKARFAYQFSGPMISMSLTRGWFTIFEQLCKDIDYALGNDKRAFHWVQIKEKFGSARVYFQMAAGISDKEPELMTKLLELKNEAEGASSKVCAACGQPGTIERDTGWMLALCARHREQQEAGTLASIWLSDNEEGSSP